jgi:hypothetical protein
VWNSNIRSRSSRYKSHPSCRSCVRRFRRCTRSPSGSPPRLDRRSPRNGAPHTLRRDDTATHRRILRCSPWPRASRGTRPRRKSVPRHPPGTRCLWCMAPSGLSKCYRLAPHPGTRNSAAGNRSRHFPDTDWRQGGRCRTDLGHLPRSGTAPLSFLRCPPDPLRREAASRCCGHRWQLKRTAQ